MLALVCPGPALPLLPRGTFHLLSKFAQLQLPSYPTSPPHPTPQCGTFHLLSKFTGTRRSCRDRLRKHAIRRRKCADGQARPSSWHWVDGQGEGDGQGEVEEAEEGEGEGEGEGEEAEDGEGEDEQDEETGRGLSGRCAWARACMALHGCMVRCAE